MAADTQKVSDISHGPEGEAVMVDTLRQNAEQDALMRRVQGQQFRESVQRQAIALTKMMGNSNLARGVREVAKQAFDQLKLRIQDINQKLNSQEPDPSGLGAILEPLNQIAGAIEGTGPQGARPAPAAPAGGIIQQTAIPSEQRTAAIDRMAAEAPIPETAAPATPPAAATQVPPAASAASSLQGLVSPRAGGGPSAPGEIGPPQPAERVPEGGAALVPEVLPPLTAEVETPEMSALRSFLTEPPPRRTPYKPGKVQGVALAFLAGLKGINAALPFIELQRKEHEATFEAESRAFERRGQGLLGLAQLTESARDRQATLSLQRAQMEWNRQIQLANLSIRQAELMSRADARNAAESYRSRAIALQERRFATPTPGVMSDITLLGEIITSGEKLRGLVDKGAGGPVASGIFQSQKWNPDTITAAALWGQYKTLFGPQRIGRATTNLEVSGLGSGVLDIGIANSRSRQLAAIDAVVSGARRDLDRLGNRYDPEYVYKLSGVPNSTLLPSRAAVPIPEGLVPVAPQGGDWLLYDEGETEVP